MCDSYITVRLLVGAEPVANALSGVQESILHMRLPSPALIQREELNPNSTCYSLLFETHGRPFPFCTKPE